MKILITAGAGFIAKNLFEQLNSEYALVSCNSKELNLLETLKVFDYLKSNRFDAIVHTATYDAAPKHSTKDPSKVLEYNLKMFFNLARCKDYFGKMIYFGSGAEFGRENWIPKMKEDYFDQHIPQDDYGFSKYIMTKYTLSSSNIYNLRLFAVFGKYEDWRVRFISNACCNALSGLPITINQNKFFDFLYIDDLIKIVKWFIDNNPKKNVYNVCTGRTIDFKTLAEKIIKISGKKLDTIIKTEGLSREYSGDNSLIMNELKDFKFSLIDSSIKVLYDWYDSNKQIIEKDKL
ncbi:MAG: NAD(P)-dependent oxidoreductase [Candidatus Omnitrophota bacterium]|nr:NAD(P)-dependent oxidoreductase [Candidatus Omnitrophota bacterium]